MLDHEALAGEIMAKDPSWNWDDFLAGSKRAATYDGKMVGIPYRITTGIMHYQKALLEQAGITKLPETFAELRNGRDRHQQAARALWLRPVRAPGAGDHDQLPAVAVFLRRRPAGLQDRRDLHQQRTRRSPRWSSGPGWCSRTRSCRPKR